MAINTQNKQYLLDVVLIRLVLIILLVIFHAFAIHTGGWFPPYDTFKPIPAYDWFGMFTHIFQLEAMTFISGILMGYQSLRKPDSIKSFSFIIKKIKRILLPCLIFGIAYYALFGDLSASPLLIFYRLINGYGHLWFLPMIFWCFLLTYLITNKLPPPKCKYILIISLLWLIFNPIAMLPLGLGVLGRYYFYFYLGFCLKQGIVRFPANNKINIGIALLLLIIFFMSWKLLREYWQADMGFAERMTRFIVCNCMNAITVTSAVFLLYVIANKSKVIEFIQHKPILVTLSGYCYGVYIYQEFILRLLYYKTSLPLHIDKFVLPWLAAGITLIASLLLCHITLRFKFGRFLIG